MLPKNIAAGLVAALLCLQDGSRLEASDRVELASGEVLFGKVLKESREEVAIQLGTGGVLTFKRASIKTVRRASSSGAEPDDGKSSDKKPISQLEQQAQTSAAHQAARDEARIKGAEPSDAAQKARAEAPVGDQSIALEEERVLLQVPGGFDPWPEGKAVNVLASYWDPVSHATFTLSKESTRRSIEEVKKQAVQSYGKIFTSFSVLRNERLRKGDRDVKPETWIVESESTTNGQTVRQIQVFVQRDDQAYTLTCSAAADAWEQYRSSFERCSTRLRFLESEAPPR